MCVVRRRRSNYRRALIFFFSQNAFFLYSDWIHSVGNVLIANPPKKANAIFALAFTSEWALLWLIIRLHIYQHILRTLPSDYGGYESMAPFFYNRRSCATDWHTLGKCLDLISAFQKKNKQKTRKMKSNLCVFVSMLHLYGIMQPTLSEIYACDWRSGIIRTRYTHCVAARPQ